MTWTARYIYSIWLWHVYCNGFCSKLSQVLLMNRVKSRFWFIVKLNGAQIPWLQIKSELSPPSISSVVYEVLVQIFHVQPSPNMVLCVQYGQTSPLGFHLLELLCWRSTTSCFDVAMDYGNFPVFLMSFFILPWYAFLRKHAIYFSLTSCERQSSSFCV